MKALTFSKPFQYLFESIIYRQGRPSYRRSTAMQCYILLHQDHARLQPSNASALYFLENALLSLYQLLTRGTSDRPQYIGTWSPPLWDFRRLSWSPPLRGTFVASVGRFRYVGPLSPQWVASATWDLCTSRYVGS